MGYIGNLEWKIKAQGLRKKGFSYNEIQKFVPVPKSTLSGWCRDIALTESQALRLFKNKLKGSAKGRIIGAKRQQEKRLKQVRELLKKGTREVGALSKRDRFIIGASLYAAEGTKADKSCGFSNSDPRLIKFMSVWFREFCQTSQNKLKGSIWIHEGLNTTKAIKFWSRISGIPITQFYKTYIAKNKPNSRKIRKNLHRYGVFSIRFSDAKVHRRMMGWIAGLFGEDVKYTQHINIPR